MLTALAGNGTRCGAVNTPRKSAGFTCPWLLSPQQYTSPSSERAQVFFAPETRAFAVNGSPTRTVKYTGGAFATRAMSVSTPRSGPSVQRFTVACPPASVTTRVGVTDPP